MVEDYWGDRMNIPAIMDKTTKAQWEVFMQRSRRAELQLRRSEREATIWQENTGYGIRVIMPRGDGAGVGFASCNSESELESTARRAHDLAKLNRSPFFELPEKKKLPSASTADKRILSSGERAVRDYAEEAQALISKERDISLTYGKVRTYAVKNEIVNSRGLAYKSIGTYIYVEMTLKVGLGSNPTEFWPSRYARRVSDVAPDKLVPKWLEIARSSLRRHTPKTKETTVIFSPSVVCDAFVPTIGFHASAEALKLNLSQFKQDDKIGSEQLTVTDDGLYPYGLRTNPFDDEGQPQQRTKLIEKGIFKKRIYDQLHAHTMRAKPTGNGIRTGFGADVDERYSTLPANANTNLSIEVGNRSLDSLIEEIDEGIIIHEAAWLNPDQITTQFGSEIRNAQEIKNGDLGEGIVGGTVSGAVLELLQNISGISNQAEITSGSSLGCVAPYIRFDRVQISGPT
jgi:predicted Zn-dependent protease